jgi:selenide,water dikinase
VKFVIDTLPIIRNLYKLEKKGRDFRFLEGRAAETSGGLLIACSKPDAFLKEYRKITENWGWVIGEVKESDKNGAEIVEGVKVIEI